MLNLTRRSDATQADFARLDREAAQRAAFRCAECDSVDGTIQWSWHNLAEARPGELPAMLYRRPEDYKNLYEVCQSCNDTVPEGYELLTDDEVDAAVADARDRVVYERFGMD